MISCVWYVAAMMWNWHTFSLSSLSLPKSVSSAFSSIFALNYKAFDTVNGKHSEVISICQEMFYTRQCRRKSFLLCFFAGRLLFWTFANEFLFHRYLFKLHHFLLHFRSFLFILMGNRKVFFHFFSQSMPKLYHLSLTQSNHELQRRKK